MSSTNLLGENLVDGSYACGFKECWTIRSYLDIDQETNEIDAAATTGTAVQGRAAAW